MMEKNSEKIKKKITGLSQLLRTTGHSLAWDNVKLIYMESN